MNNSIHPSPDRKHFLLRAMHLCDETIILLNCITRNPSELKDTLVQLANNIQVFGAMPDTELVPIINSFPESQTKFFNMYTHPEYGRSIEMTVKTQCNAIIRFIQLYLDIPQTTSTTQIVSQETKSICML